MYMGKLYICPSCEHSTSSKNDMRRHLFRRMSCLKSGKIQLTDEIREEVLINQTYDQEQEQEQTKSASKSKSMSYLCPRCNYSAIQKCDMRNHLYRKNKCANKNSLDLTDDIRKKVLDDHIYRLPKAIEYGSVTTISDNQIINNNYQLINYVGQLDTEDKLNQFLGHREQQLLDLEDHMETHFDPRVKRLEDPRYRATYGMGPTDFLRLVNDATLVKAGEINRFNVIFDSRIRRLKLFRGTKWNSMFIDDGVCELVHLIKSYFLDEYEMYLIRRIHDSKRHFSDCNDCRRHLEEYYHFLIAFKCPPKIFGMTDNEIVGRELIEGNDSYLETHYLEKYHELKKNGKEIDNRRVRQQVASIVKENTVQNVDQLNKGILELLKADEGFKNQILN